MSHDLDSLTRRYIAATDELIGKRKFGEGLFGMPDSAKSSPIHMEFYNAVEASVSEAAGEAPDADTADDLVKFLLKASTNYPTGSLAGWMLVAIQNHALPIIPYMSAAVREELSVWYEKAFPRLQRMPNQQKIAKALKKGQ